MKAWLEIILAKSNEALNTTSKLLALKSHVGYSHKMRAQAYYMLHEQKKALYEIDEAIKLMPHEGTPYQIKGQILTAMGHNAEAARCNKIRALVGQLYCTWDKVLESNREFTRPSATRKTTFHQEYAAGQRAFGRLAFQGAADYFERAIQLKPDCLAAYLYHAQALEALDKWSESVPDLNHLIAQGDNTMIPILISPQDISKTPYEKWDRFDTNMAEAYKRRARCYSSMQKHALAIEDLKIAIKQQPEDRWTWECRANAYLCFKKYKQAIDDYNKVEKLEPTYPHAGPKIIECCLNIGDYQKAIVRISWILKKTPIDDVMLLNRAEALSHLGFHKEAIDDLTFIMSTSPEYVEVFLRRAREYEALRNLQAALKDYTAVINMESGTRKSRQALAGRERILLELKQQTPKPKAL